MISPAPAIAISACRRFRRRALHFGNALSDLALTGGAEMPYFRRHERP
jgi:hypothetical protein